MEVFPFMCLNTVVEGMRQTVKVVASFLPVATFDS